MSLRSTLHGETFHPVVGPMAEARSLHVAQSRIVERAAQSERFIVWDVGLGAAANAVAVLEALAVLGPDAPASPFAAPPRGSGAPRLIHSTRSAIDASGSLLLGGIFNSESL